MKNIIIGNNCKCKTYEVIDIDISITAYGIGEKIKFISPVGNELYIPVFQKDKNCKVVRFSPDINGTWQYGDENFSGNIICEEALYENFQGPLKIAENETDFIYNNGKHCFLMGYECNWLWAINMKSSDQKKLDCFIKKIKSFNFNLMRVNLFCYDTEWCKGNICDNDYGPPPMYCFGGTNEEPDFNVINYDFFDCFDDMMECLISNGIYICLYFKVFNKLVNWPERGSEQEKRFFDHVISRYQAYSNIIWDFSKEAYYEIHKEYIVDFYKNIDETDAYHRLKTLHDDKIFYMNSSFRKNIDFLSSQQHFDTYTTSILYHNYKMPVVAAEFGYECGAKGVEDLSYMYGQSPEEFVRRAWEVVMARAYPTYYYTYTAWDIISTNDNPMGYNYWKIMRNYLIKEKWEEYLPRPEYCLWRGRALERNTSEYIYLIEAGEHALFYLPGKASAIELRFLNIYTGEENKVIYSKNEIETRGETELVVITNPWKEQWAVVHLKKL